MTVEQQREWTVVGVEDDGGTATRADGCGVEDDGGTATRADGCGGRG